MQAPLLAISDLSVGFETRAGNVRGLSSISLSVPAGGALGLVGESGSGKSTLAYAIMRYLPRNGRVAGGTIMFEGRDLLTLPEAGLRRVRGARIAMVYQEPMATLNPSMTVARQLAEVPMLHQGASATAARAAASEMLDAVRLADASRILDSYPHQLSGGQQQRVVIAMALMARPALLILDEPTTALDATVAAGIVALIGDLRRDLGTALLFISHDLGLVRETCDAIAVLYAGETVETAPSRTVFERPRHPYTRSLLRALPRLDVAHPPVAIPGSLPSLAGLPRGCRFAPRCADAVPGRCDVAPLPMLPVDASHATRCRRWPEIDWSAPAPSFPPKPAAPPGAPILAVDGLTKTYALSGSSRTVKALIDLTLQARRGETFAIVGESGCGKTTLARVLAGLDPATAGSVRLGDSEVAAVPVRRRAAATVAAMQMVFQNPYDTLNPARRVGSQLVRALERLRVGRTAAERRERMHDLLTLVRLPTSVASRYPGQLSGGEKQRIAIARAFAGRPDAIIADEPTSALDVSVQAAIATLFADLQRANGTTLLLISHDLGLVRSLADRVLVMYLGRIVETGSAAQVFAPPYHPYTEALLSAVLVAEADARRAPILLDGALPSAVDPPSGCPFHARCPRRHQVPGDACRTTLPALAARAPGHLVRCHLPVAVFDSMEPALGTAKGRHRSAEAR